MCLTRLQETSSFRIYDRRRTVSFFIKLHLYFVLVIRILLFLFSFGQKFVLAQNSMDSMDNERGALGGYEYGNLKSVLLQVLAKKRIVSMGESTFREYHQEIFRCSLVIENGL